MRKVKKLKLGKETLRRLGSDVMRQVAGGATDHTECYGGTCTASAGCWTAGECVSWQIPCPEV